ncbi:MAG TPA: rhodanese-like domain-containing protein [Nocardioidaceae bacterium]|nr:rhodanese-like domain-containing protein [Nocardioidaceae bacterium]
MREVDIDQFARAHSEGATVIDVREVQEYVEGHVAGAELIPMGHVPNQMSNLSKDEPVYLICRSGNRSLAVADFMIAAGFDARSVAGGMVAWARSGRPVVAGQEPGTSDGSPS